MTAAYDRWVASGEPWTVAPVLVQVIAQLKAAFPGSAGAFGAIGDLSHLTADPPLDHTPYSVDGWPLPDPQWVVCASDIMAYAVGGTAAAQKIFDHLLASAKDGSAPWIKYLIWYGKNYDVRNNFQPADADNHYDHIHISVRTDQLNYQLGGWSILGDDMPTADEIAKAVIDKVVPWYSTAQAGRMAAAGWPAPGISLRGLLTYTFEASRTDVVSAILAKLPQSDAALTKADVESALREVFATAGEAPATTTAG